MSRITRPTNDMCNCRHYQLPAKSASHASVYRKFFPKEVVQEVWEQNRARIFSLANLKTETHPVPNLLKYLPMKTEHYSEIVETILPAVFKLWYTARGLHMQIEMIHFLAEFVRNFPGRIDWCPHMCLLYDNLLDFMNGSKQSETTKLYITSFAICLVDSLPDDFRQASDKHCKSYFESFITACNTTVHPSSRHASINMHAHMMNKISLAFVVRVIKTLISNTSCLPSKEQWITPELVDRTLDVILPLFFDRLLFNSRDAIADQASIALGLLGALRPERVLSRVLQLLDQAKERSDMPLRLTRSLEALNRTVYLIGGSNLALFTHTPRHFFLNKGPVQKADHKTFIDQHLKAMAFPGVRCLFVGILKTLSNFLDISKTAHFDITCSSITSLCKFFQGSKYT
ncbi:hypothetical protein Ciccas_011153 [Cichlidogyrus casuarinus]|uniref:Uncharacterized protein n=1 Tax=Cichlidogyrus casuarinus TaxID=1844966 RepID=A0ABD2PS24_9PLAT